MLVNMEITGGKSNLLSWSLLCNSFLRTQQRAQHSLEHTAVLSLLVWEALALATIMEPAGAVIVA